MMSIDECHKKHGIDDFSLISVFSWDFYQKVIKKEGTVGDKMENLTTVLRIAYKIRDDMAIKKDPYFDYLDLFWSEFFENLPKIDLSDSELENFVEKTDEFIYRIKT